MINKISLSLLLSFVAVCTSSCSTEQINDSNHGNTYSNNMNNIWCETAWKNYQRPPIDNRSEKK